ncbi:MULTISPECIES: hypothetical protein [unclassified Bradyrhizobium]|jgi:hypothetical protein|uniref:hypothetical protein n=1 Tax=unclassified Bradyrhizobium TaxID=2631580 RepID=UPI001FFA1DAA|nr:MULTISPECIES: hypothetical protein [unclassified Bradyrhizobium]MCK1275955.1 hypothetical protein [Bradyrhizobium sp. 61]MCK1448054.1 hypothetical protein [Bradyrhizobium sp. 48]MCK1465446.1 hypothetical protein [Bradyrhizobium sp. 2]
MTDDKLHQQANSAPTGQQVSEQKISSNSHKDALGDSSLDDVSGGLWPSVMSGSTYNRTI